MDGTEWDNVDLNVDHFISTTARHLAYLYGT